MGRRSRLIPNINSLLLQLHHLRTGSGSVDHKSSRCSRTGNDGIKKQKHGGSTTTFITANDSSIDTDTDETDTTCTNRNVPVTVPVRGVRFGNCEIRSYTQVLGDHPCCLEGCPIQLGWTYNPNNIISIPITEYETTKLLNVLHGDNNSMRLSPEERKFILFKQFSSLSSSSLSISSCDSVSSLEDDSESEHSSHSSSASISQSTSVQQSLESSSSVPVQSQLQQQQSSSEQSPSPSDLLCERERDCERELRRECNKLNRDSRNSCRKRNRRNQQEFFGNCR